MENNLIVIFFQYPLEEIREAFIREIAILYQVYADYSAS